MLLTLWLFFPLSFCDCRLLHYMGGGEEKEKKRQNLNTCTVLRVHKSMIFGKATLFMLSLLLRGNTEQEDPNKSHAIVWHPNA